MFVTARVQNDIDAPRTNALDFPRYIDLSGIEAVRGAEIQGQRKSLGMYVDSDHDCCATQMGRHDGSHPYSADTEHQRRLAAFHRQGA